ncbi:MAG: NAD-dependent epimerase/dehydratase family protein [Bacteroidales bacterium]|jgi:UDP-glucuronate 4-epimerase|nr:NAD-dependent epimerase/dehydratase family protein [Bacteroidales bacterium]
MKILVTGTAGFIGYHLSNKLLECGNTVVGIDNINDYYSVELKFARLKEAGISKEAQNWHHKIVSSVNKNYSFYRMNLENGEEIKRLFETEKFDIVCNIAAQAGVRYSIENPMAYIQSNIVGFANILEACRNNSVQHLIYASSSSVYGNSSKMPLATSDPVDNPISLYAATKKSNELMAYTYSHLFGLQTTGLRFFTVYGPWGRPDMAYFSFTKNIIEDKTVKIFNNGNLYRDFTYIDDIVEGISKIIEKSQTHTQNRKVQVPYKIYNIGSSNPFKLIDFIEVIEKVLGKKAKKEFCNMQPGDVYKTFADVSELENEFNYSPNTPLEEGIRKFVDWYKSFYT